MLNLVLKRVNWVHNLKISPPSSFEQKEHNKKCHIPPLKKTTISAKRKLFSIIIDLKGVFCLTLLHKISLFNMFITPNYLF